MAPPRSKKLISEVKAQGQNAVAITDHGYCFGAYEFHKAAAEGIKPIIGVEAYVTPWNIAIWVGSQAVG